MISAERVMAYSKLESEASLETLPPASPPPKEWPSQGHIEFQDLSYRHSSDGPLVLKGINCTINGGEKVINKHMELYIILGINNNCYLSAVSGWYCWSNRCW